MKPIFLTGTGTNVGKTLVAAIVAEAIQADYWKPVQAGYDSGTDSLWIKKMISNKKTIIHPELYKLNLAASPHIAAKAEQQRIKVKEIINHLPNTTNHLIIEGAGGLMVPLNEKEFVLHLVKDLQATVIIVSKNELGSINHPLHPLAPLPTTRASSRPKPAYTSPSIFGSYPGNTAFHDALPMCRDTSSPSTSRKSVVTARSRPS